LRVIRAEFNTLGVRDELATIVNVRCAAFDPFNKTRTVHVPPRLDTELSSVSIEYRHPEPAPTLPVERRCSEPSGLNHWNSRFSPVPLLYGKAA
jgi:hypothetical protein